MAPSSALNMGHSLATPTISRNSVRPNTRSLPEAPIDYPKSQSAWIERRRRSSKLASSVSSVGLGGARKVARERKGVVGEGSERGQARRKLARRRQPQSQAKVRVERAERTAKKSTASGSAYPNGCASSSAPLGPERAELVDQMRLSGDKSDADDGAPTTVDMASATRDCERAANSLTLAACSLSASPDPANPLEAVGSADLGAVEAPDAPSNLRSSSPTRPPSRSSNSSRPTSARPAGCQVSNTNGRQQAQHVAVSWPTVMQTGSKKSPGGSGERSEIGAAEQVKSDSKAATGLLASVPFERLASLFGGGEDPSANNSGSRRSGVMTSLQLAKSCSSGNMFGSGGRLQRICLGMVGRQESSSAGQVVARELAEQQPKYLSSEQLQRVRDWLESQPGGQVSKWLRVSIYDRCSCCATNANRALA